jgi:WD40 repeat protein
MRQHEAPEAIAPMERTPVTRRQALVYSASLAAGAAAFSTARADDEIRLTFGAAVWDIAFSPNGQLIAVARENRLLIQHLIYNRRIIGRCDPSQQLVPVFGLAFLPDGASIVTTGGDTIQLWDAITGKAFSKPLSHKFLSTFSHSRDGTRIVTGSDDGTVRLWDTATQKPIGKGMWHTGPVNSAIFSPDAKHIVTASHDKTARLWNGVTGEPMGAVMRHEDVVASAIFSPDGIRVATASWDKTVRLWDAATGMPAGEVLPHDEAVAMVAYSPDGSRIVTGSNTGLSLWDGAAGKEVERVEGPVQSVAFSPDGTRIMTTDSESRITLRDAATAKLLRRIGHPRLTKARFSPDGTMIASCSADGSVILTQL